jgi:hypothetical protein
LQAAIPMVSNKKKQQINKQQYQEQ